MAYTEFYCQTTASNLNAGSTTADAAVYTSTNGNWDGTSIFTPVDGSTPASTVSVGDFASVFLDAATVAVYIGRITAVAAGVNGAITISTTAKSGTAPASGATGRTIKVGGAWEGPNGTTTFPFGFITNTLTNSSTNPARINMKAGTYSVTASVVHANAGPLTIQGYTSSVGDGGRFTIDGGTSGSSYIPLNPTGNDIQVIDAIVQNNGATGNSNGLTFTSNRGLLKRVTVTAVRGNGIVINAITVRAIECEAYACNQSNSAATGGFSCNGGELIRCIAHNNTGSNSSGFICGSASSNVDFVDCIADTNGRHGFFINQGTLRFSFIGCVSYGNTSAGFADSVTTSNNIYIENCIAANNGTWGVDITGASCGLSLQNVGFYSNTSGEVNTVGTQTMYDNSGSVSFASAPMTDPANGDFSPTISTAKNAGRGVFVQDAGSYSGTTTSYPDIGAVQHNDSGGGGASVPTINLGQSGVRIV